MMQLKITALLNPEFCVRQMNIQIRRLISYCFSFNEVDIQYFFVSLVVRIMQLTSAELLVALAYLFSH